MKIRIQVTGGVGNQLFIWNGAHYMQALFNCPVELLFVDDKNSRSDRKLEIEKIAKYCHHPISVKSSKGIGVLYRVLDRFQLERNQKSKKFLQSFGIYSFNNPVSDIFFEHSKPRLIRSYFQRTDLVDLTWESWSSEFKDMIEAVSVAEIASEINYNAIHIRRGDTLDLAGTHGVLAESYFETSMNSSIRTYVCTDESRIPIGYLKAIQPAAVYTPRELDVWQTIKLFINAQSFQGANSTLSWWASYARLRSGKLNTSLPNPWTRTLQGYEKALHIDGVSYLDARFVNAE
jgi:hypothetical protein